MLRKSLTRCCFSAVPFALPHPKANPSIDFKLEDIPLKRAWSYKSPTFVKRGRQVERLSHLKTNEHLKEHLFREFPFLQELDLTNFAIKGGVFSSLLMSSRPSDIDLYIVGLDHENAVKAIDRLLNQIVKLTFDNAVRKSKSPDFVDLTFTGRGRGWGRGRGQGRQGQRDRERFQKAYASRMLERIVGSRHGPVITLSGVEGLSVPMQIIATPFATIEELTHSGDVDSGCVSFYQGNLHFTERSAFAIQNWANVIQAPSGINSRRLLSYFDRGFDIVLPELDVSKIRQPDPRLNLKPFFRLLDGQIEIETEVPDPNRPNRLVVQSLERISLSSIAAETSQGAAAAQRAQTPQSIGSNVDHDIHAKQGELDKAETKTLVLGAMRHNVKELHSDDPRFKFTAGGRHITNLAEFRSPPINSRHIENTLQHKRVSALDKDPLSPGAGFATLMNYFPGVSFSETLSAMIPDADEGDEEVKQRVQDACAQAERDQCTKSLERLDVVKQKMLEQPLDEILKMQFQMTPLETVYGNMRVKQ